MIIAELREEQKLQIGRKREIAFCEGFYAYVGSAISGLEKRVERHLSRNKKLHWHIDYLLEEAEIRMIITANTRRKEECIVAQALAASMSFVPGFGSSDCSCSSHLFYSRELEILRTHAIKALLSLGLKPHCLLL